MRKIENKTQVTVLLGFLFLQTLLAELLPKSVGWSWLSYYLDFSLVLSAALVVFKCFMVIIFYGKPSCQTASYICCLPCLLHRLERGEMPEDCEDCLLTSPLPEQSNAPGNQHSGGFKVADVHWQYGARVINYIFTGFFTLLSLILFCSVYFLIIEGQNIRAKIIKM